ncbi:uncharacterized protein N7459_000165 [Penicillium hispanicum]|uniref:uncharacterized protein n=1 Tax=Penicillium hispanicum TaxID=1080232 RepID=UPI0025404E10|nr:uncharacterized protein N7459_000165 [Penicillium hispanicum]KAJ5593957.1 hypothetical protein N7459_000165 [Penicillium hispanicum]
MPLSLSERNQRDQRQPGKPKKRVITPARREQNRAAQRAWRQRRRERLESSQVPQSRTSFLHLTDLDTLDQSDRNVAHAAGLRHQEDLGRIPDAPRHELLHSPASTLDSHPETYPEMPSTDTRHDLSRHSEPSLLSHQGRNLTDSDSSPDSRSLHVQETNHPLLLADPKLNTLQDTRTEILLAALNNALCLGFDISNLMNCQEGGMSPFFRSITPSDNPRDLVASRLNPSIPIHLQPTMSQILVPHHASIDLIPLPLLRERVIMMSFAMPHAFNLWDLKLDVYVRHGLVTRRHGGECLPWDQKYWEMKPWFKTKWGVSTCE